ncbi:MAG: protein tyrosine phosphatase family protein [Acidimicrobiia bacterium]
MSIEDSYNFRRIHDGLTTSGSLSVAQLGGLRAEGYDAVINLLPDSNARAVADEASIVQDQGVVYVYIPVDFAAPTHADLEAFAGAMDALAGQKVHVHCAANYRVSAFYALYALRNGSYTEDEADELMHSVWNPDDDAAWTDFIANERTR